MKQHSHQPGPSATQLFEILVRENALMLTAFLRSVVHGDDVVDDLFQETMLVAWRRMDDYDRTLPFGPWLRGIAGRLVLEHRRKAATRSTLACEPAVLEALEEEFRKFERVPADSFRARLERLASCIERLPVAMRDAVEDLYSRGMTLRALAAAGGLNEETAKKRVQRARLLLAECLDSGGAA